MPYKLPDPPPDTPRVNEGEFASDEDCYGQISGLISSGKARQIERDLNKARELLRRLVSLCEQTDWDDTGRDLLDEIGQEIS